MTTLDDVYKERDMCIALIAKFAQYNELRVGIGYHAEEPWENDWRNIIYIDLPTGQISWHIHDSELAMFNFLPYYHATWDGHTTEEKYRRLLEYCDA
jgi:hypothetical protein